MTKVGLTQDIILAENEAFFRAYAFQYMPTWLNPKSGGSGPKHFSSPAIFWDSFKGV